MEMHIKLMDAMIRIVETGGGYAIWLLAIYLVINLMKVGVIALVIYKIIIQAFTLLTNYLSLRFISNKDKISLLSTECSDKLVCSMVEFQENMKEATKNFIEDANVLLKGSKGSQEKK